MAGAEHADVYGKTSERRDWNCAQLPLYWFTRVSPNTGPMKAIRRQLVPWLSILLWAGMSPAQELPKKKPVPLAGLPDLKPPAESLALVEEKDTLYLANTTSKEIPAPVFGFEPAFKEAFVNGRWQRCQSFPGEIVVNKCADGILDALPPPLPPGHAWLLQARDRYTGDTEGEIRFCLPLINAAPLATKPRKGSYSEVELESSSKDLCSYWGLNEELHEFFKGNRPDKGTVFTSIGELAATLELERSYDKCGLTRQSVARWLEKNPKGFATTIPAEMTALREVLAKPWDRIRDDRNRLETCLNALSEAGRKKHPVGTPARYPAMVWRYLSVQSRLRKADEYCLNPERWDAIERMRASGNDWDAGPGELAKLGLLAEKSVRSANKLEAKAARPFLRFSVAQAD